MKLFTVQTASLEYGVSQKTILRAIKSGKLVTERAGTGKRSKHLIQEKLLNELYRQSVSKGSKSNKSKSSIVPVPREVWDRLNKVLDDNAEEKRHMNDRLDSLQQLLDQQQKLTGALQQQVFLLQSPPITTTSSTSHRNSITPKKSRKASPPKTSKSFWERLFRG